MINLALPLQVTDQPQLRPNLSQLFHYQTTALSSISMHQSHMGGEGLFKMHIPGMYPQRFHHSKSGVRPRNGCF